MARDWNLLHMETFESTGWWQEDMDITQHYPYSKSNGNEGVGCCVVHDMKLRIFSLNSLPHSCLLAALFYFTLHVFTLYIFTCHAFTLLHFHSLTNLTRSLISPSNVLSCFLFFEKVIRETWKERPSTRTKNFNNK
jgi:hypothetical protein